MVRLEELITSARKARDTRFGGDILFYAPSVKHYESTEFPPGRPHDFVPVSVTGPVCELGCDHCKGRLLASMQEVRDPADLLSLASRLADRGCRGLLVSGGSDLDGRVPLLPFVDAMARIRQTLGLKIVVHTGIVTEDLALGLARAGVECAMLDVVGDAGTIEHVLHLDGGPEMIAASLEILEGSGVRTVPHVVVGLASGRLAGELEALEIIARGRPSAVVVVVLDPLSGTPMGGLEPPAVHDVATVLARARLRFPHVPVMLGCARPGGPHRAETDRFALEAGLNGIAFPAEGTVALARQMGYEPRFARECCSLVIDAMDPAGDT
ncbi:MAG: radical SAM protein [Deltaproteobacteria bacterium]|nr:radical SAM protein [Deltaproteobacteria bacterium]